MIHIVIFLCVYVYIARGCVGSRPEINQVNGEGQAERYLQGVEGAAALLLIFH